MQSVQAATADVCVPTVASGALVIDVERLDRPLHETATLVYRRLFTGRRLTVPIYAALHGCTLADARHILAIPCEVTPGDGGAASPTGDGQWTAQDQSLARIGDHDSPTADRHDLSPPRFRPTAVTSDARRGDLARALEIIQAVGKVWNVDPSSLPASTRIPAIVRPRQMAMAVIARECPGLSLVMIGKLLGRRSHKAVLHACRMHALRGECDAPYAAIAAALEASLAGRPGAPRAA